MSLRPAASARHRSLVRTANGSRSAPQALARAYELALPVLRKPVAVPPPAAGGAAFPGPRVVPDVLAGA
jgi:hypothetical protein